MARVTHFSKLIVWQLAHAIRVEVLRLTAEPRFARDLKLRSQIEDAAHSMCRNISEGFGGTHKEFARFLRISRRSANEVQDAVEGALLKGYVTLTDVAALRMLFNRIYPALSRLLLYLDTTPNPRATNRAPPDQPGPDAPRPRPRRETKPRRADAPRPHGLNRDDDST